MTDTDITALVERLRDPLTFSYWGSNAQTPICREAADALEACQAEIEDNEQDIRDLDELVDIWKARAEKAEAALTDFWYILGHDYEVIVFRTADEAAAALPALTEACQDDTYYAIFKGRYGEEFSGWIGRRRPHDE